MLTSKKRLNASPTFSNMIGKVYLTLVFLDSKLIVNFSSTQIVSSKYMHTTLK